MKTSLIKTVSLFLGVTILLGWACTEMYDFEKLSGMIQYDPEVDAPLVRGSLTAEDLFASWDSLMENNGDTVVLAFRKDSLFNINVEDFSGIPPQDTSEFNLIPDKSYPFMPLDTFVIDSTVYYAMTFDNNMRADSIFIDDGFLYIDVHSSFRHSGTLDIYCPEVFIDGQLFHRKIQISSTDGMFSMDTLFPLNHAKVYVNNTIPGQPYIRNFYHLVLHKNPGQIIYISDRVQIHFSFVELDKFEALFGYAGNEIYSESITFPTGLEAIEGLSGTFSVTDPHINFNYENSFGIPIGLDLFVQGYFKDGRTVDLDPPQQVMEASDNYLLPGVAGSLQYDSINLPNISELLTFPVADSLSVEGEAVANPGVTNASNFVLKNSGFLIGLELKVPLAFKANLQLRDTFRITAVEKPDEVDFIEYARLHYRIRNEFPVDLYPYLILYDSIADVNRDTLLLTESVSDPFIKAARVDEKGVTLVSEVEDYTGTIELTGELMDHFFYDTNKLIMVGGFNSYQKGKVVILTTYRFDFRCNLDAKIRYVTNMNNKNQ